MSDSGGIPGMQYTNPDGRPKSRLEMDQWMRKEMPKVFWLRIHACRTFGLSKQLAYDMREICVRHWLLDEMIRRGSITGDLLGVNANTSNDEGELRQFTQRLAAMIQAGQAVQPQHAEGVDMNYTPPPPPVPMGPPAAPAPGPAYPPGPPGQPPQQYQPPGPPIQGYPPGPPAPPAGPPAAPQYAAPPPMGPPGYAPPPAGVPTAPPPMAAPPGPPAPMGPPAAAPAPARRGGRKAAGEAGPAVAPPPPAGPPMGPPGAPQGFAPAGFAPPAPQGYAPPPPAAPMMQAPVAPPQAQAPAAPAEVDLTPLLQRFDALAAANAQLQQQNTALTKKVDMLSMAVTIVCRGIYQKQGSADVAGLLTELGIPLPQ